jgi:hypothetical protein
MQDNRTPSDHSAVDEGLAEVIKTINRTWRAKSLP